MAKSTGSEQDRSSKFSNSNGLTDLAIGSMLSNYGITKHQSRYKIQINSATSKIRTKICPHKQYHQSTKQSSNFLDHQQFCVINPTMFFIMNRKCVQQYVWLSKSRHLVVKSYAKQICMQSTVHTGLPNFGSSETLGFC